MRRRLIAVAALLAVLGLGGAIAWTDSDGGSGARPGALASSGPDTRALLDRGVQQTLAGRYDEATATLRQLLAVDPGNKYAWFNLGYIAQVGKDSAGAVRDYDKALAADPAYTPAMFNKAILLEASDVDGAIALYRRILTEDARAPTVHLRLGLLLDRKGDHGGAHGEFAAAVSGDPQLMDSVPAGYRSDLPGQ